MTIKYPDTAPLPWANDNGYGYWWRTIEDGEVVYYTRLYEMRIKTMNTYLPEGTTPQENLVRWLRGTLVGGPLPSGVKVCAGLTDPKAWFVRPTESEVEEAMVKGGGYQAMADRLGLTRDGLADRLVELCPEAYGPNGLTSCHAVLRAIRGN